jgi:DNA (cytosine-5)-methyltransferase 1
MWDVPRFAEFHKYNIIIAENVVEVLRWSLFQDWLRVMDTLGYAHKIVCLNSMFCHPTPQSRDRVYIVFWKKGNRAPDLDFRPAARCYRCEKEVRARQTWKNGRTVGKYRTQYVYTCPACRHEVQPYYFAALNALDLSLPAQRIGDRVRPLRPRTLERIKFGLEKYGNRALLVTTNQTNRLGGRVRTVMDPGFTQPGCNVTGFLRPAFLVEVANTHSNARGIKGLDDPHPAQTTQTSSALVNLPFLTTAGSRDSAAGAIDAMPTQTGSERLAVAGAPFFATLHGKSKAHAGSDPMSTVASSGAHQGLVVPPASVVTLREHSTPAALDDSLTTVCTGGGHMLVQGAALLTMRDSRGVGYLLRELDRAMGTQVGSCTQDALISKVPFIASAYRTHNVSPADHPVPTVSTVDRHALVSPGEEIDVEDCYFRMLQPDEIGAAMAFPGDYIVLGNKRDKVKQFGNAVTPPAMEWLIGQAAASLHPERAA